MTMTTDISKLDAKRIARRAKGMKKAKNLPTIKETPYKELSANMQDMEVYRRDWDSLHDVRRRYRRAAKFHRGDQWSDITVGNDGSYMTEADHIIEQGLLPMKQNVIRPMVKSLSGLFRSETGKSIVISRQEKAGDIEKMLSNTLQDVLQTNMTREIDPRTFELYLLSGLPVQRVGYDYIDNLQQHDVVIDYIDPQYVFFNTDIRDVRLKDLRRIGQIHDITKEELYVHFAKNNADKLALDKLYSGITERELQNNYGLSAKRGASLNFYLPSEPHMCRVIEVWEKKAVDVITYWDKSRGYEGVWDGTINELYAENEARILTFKEKGIAEELWDSMLIHIDEGVAFKWFYKFMTPMGHILREGETPYRHKMHPFIMYPFPLINGEVWGVVEDVIDQQKNINRLFTVDDYIRTTSAKNPVVFDKNSLDGQNPDDLAESYREIGGVIVLDLSGNKQKPVELTGKMGNLGTTDMIGLQLKYLQDIGGVQPAMQGQAGNASTPASKYAMEIQQTTLNNRDLLESFQSFRKERDMKVVHTFIQFYKDKRYLAVSSKGDKQFYDPELINDLAKFNLVIGQSMDSPTYKGWIDELLKDLVLQGIINAEQFFEHCNLPFAESMLEDIRNAKEGIQNGTMNPQDATNNIMNKFAQQPGVDMNNINKVAGMLQNNAA